MTHPSIKHLIEFVCHQFERKIYNSDILNEEYFVLLKQFPEKIKKQAEKSMETLKQVDTLKLLTAVAIEPAYLQSISELNDAFQKCNIMERRQITQAQLAPFQVDQIARQWALAPGIILAYERVKDVRI